MLLPRHFRRSRGRILHLAHALLLLVIHPPALRLPITFRVEVSATLPFGLRLLHLDAGNPSRFRIASLRERQVEHTCAGIYLHHASDNDARPSMDIP